jgi:hypothetical protein
MKIEQSQWSSIHQGWEPLLSSGTLGDVAQVVFVFGNPKLINEHLLFDSVRNVYSKAHVFGCSTSGEIQNAQVCDDTIALTAMALEHSQVATSQVHVESIDGSFEAGEQLIKQLNPYDLRHVLIFSDALLINGSDLVNGISAALPPGVTVSGGFASGAFAAGDPTAERVTYVWCDHEPERSKVIALGFYGDRLQIGTSAAGGWKLFGTDRLITKAKKNVIYEFDGRPALALYKQYLGEFAEELPMSANRFPLGLRIDDCQNRVVRGIIGIDEKEQSVTCAANISEGSQVCFMVGNVEDLPGGALKAAKESTTNLTDSQSQFSLLVSCRARRNIMKQRTEEEVEAVSEGLGERTIMTGFYACGEIATIAGGATAELHNETMVVTSFTEV